MRRALAAVVAFALVAPVAACTKVATGAGGARHNAFTQPHVLRFADGLDVPGLNPHLVTTVGLGFMSQMTMAYLVRYDARNEPEPELATEVPSQRNGGVSADGRTITWHLRRGVKWSDGAPFDADDVVFSTQTVLNPRNNEIGRDGWDLIANVAEPDKYTVVFHLRKPFTSFLPVFFTTAGANPCVLPKHILGGLPDINAAPYNALPVGIGPFRYAEWARGDHVTMEANPYYWRGRPKLDRVVYRIVTDRNTLLTQLQSGGLDMWAYVPSGFAGRAKDVAGFHVLSRPGYIYDHLDFNTARPTGADPEVRRALRLAIDRPALLAKAGHGFGALQESVIPAAVVTSDRTIPLAPYDPLRAKRMLDAAGWRPGPDGIRRKAGVRLAFDLATESGSPDADTRIELIRASWQQLGVALEAHHYAPGQFFAPLSAGGIMYGGKFDAIMFAWEGDPSGDTSSQYECTQRPPNGQDIPRYCSAIADRAFEAYKTSFDPAQRTAASQTFQRQIAADVPVIVLDTRENIFAVNDDLTGFHPNSASPFDDMMHVDI